MSQVLINKNFQRKIVNIFLPIVLAYFLSTQKKRLIKTILLSTHNICFGREIRKLFSVTHSYLKSHKEVVSRQHLKE